jgi:multiple sugar transport system substrate-binding protein
MLKKLLFAVTLTLVIALVVAPVAAQNRVVVQWFVGLGTGTNEEQIAAQNAVVEAFNASQDRITLELILAASNQVAPDTLSTLIAGGTPPDIVGPVGFAGANQFAGQWLDLQPLVDASGYDLGQYPESLVNIYRSEEGLLGIPFAVFPSLIFYNIELFDEADLNYPPSVVGEPYIMPDGTEVEWNWDTLAEIAMILTVDANGNDATMPEFDPAAIEQFGFNHQWGTLRAEMSVFGGVDFYNEETGEVRLPDSAREHLRWMYDALWTKHFMPTATYDNSQMLNAGNAFASGRVAMARVMSWYTCCLDALADPWGLAVMPTYNGQTYSPTDADTFRILATTDTPAEAFEAMTYLQGEAALQLLRTYGAYPALPDIQDDFIASIQERYPLAQHLEIIPDMLAYAVSPHHESYYPNFNRGQQRFNDFRTLLYGDTGASIDLEAEIERLEADLRAIIAEAS